MRRLLAALLIAQAAEPPGLRLQNGGTTQGYISTLNCTGGATCTRAGTKGTLNVAAGGTPSGSAGNLQTNNGAGGFGAYAGGVCAYAVKQLDASGTATCTAAPTIPTDISGASYWTKVAEGSLSNEVALGSLASGLILNTTATGVPTIYGGTSCTNQFNRSLSAAGAATCAGVGVGDFTANQGTTTTLLHGNAAGQPSWASVVDGDFSGQLAEAHGGTNATALTCTNQFLTSNGTSYSCSTDTLAGAQHANQGTTTTLLHGNAAGNPAWSGVALADFVANLGTTTTLLHGNAAGQPAFSGVALADFVANLGTTTTVLHGNAAGQPAFSAMTASDFGTQTANTVLSGPTSGGAATPTFRLLVGADLPNPAASTLGGIESLASVASKWINTISTSGVPSATQPATTDISGDPVKTFVTSDVNITSATASLITGLTLTVAASTSYGFACNIAETNTATSAMRYAVSTPASPTTVNATVIHFTTVLTSAVTEAITGAWATTCTNCTAAVTASVSATTHNTILSGSVLNGVNTGSIQIFAAASTAAQANVAKKGSWCEWWTP